MRQANGEVILSGVPNEMSLIQGLIAQTRPDLRYHVFPDSCEAMEYMDGNFENVVAVVGSLAKVGMFEAARYSLTPLLEASLCDTRFVQSAVGIVSTARHETIEDIMAAYPRITYGASLRHLSTHVLDAWAISLGENQG